MPYNLPKPSCTSNVKRHWKNINKFPKDLLMNAFHKKKQIALKNNRLIFSYSLPKAKTAQLWFITNFFAQSLPEVKTVQAFGLLQNFLTQSLPKAKTAQFWFITEFLLGVFQKPRQFRLLVCYRYFLLRVFQKPRQFRLLV